MTDDLNCYTFLAAMLATIIAITNVCDVAQNIRKSTEKRGEQDALLVLPIILLGEQLFPLLPLLPRLGLYVYTVSQKTTLMLHTIDSTHINRFR